MQAPQVFARMMDRSQEMRSSLLSSAAMHSAHAVAILAGSGVIQRAKQTMHGMHRGRHHRWRSVPTLPVNQIVDCGLGEAVEGAAHRVQAVCAALSRRQRLPRRRSRQK